MINNNKTTATDLTVNPKTDIKFDLTETLKDVLEDKRITAGKDKISTSEIIAKYPEGISITEFELRFDETNKYLIILFAEDETKFYCGGNKFVTLFNQLDEACNNHGVDIHDYLKKNPIKIKIGLKTSRNGREYVTIEPAK